MGVDKDVVEKHMKVKHSTIKYLELSVQTILKIIHQSTADSTHSQQYIQLNGTPADGKIDLEGGKARDPLRPSSI